ncbi:membrane bound PAS domain-containing adenylate/guanylate cyclase, partial [Reticulomyxa filosa]
RWEFDVVKIEHVGNAYLVCGGIMSQDESFNHAEASFVCVSTSLKKHESYNNYKKVIRLGLRFRRIVDKVNAKLQVHCELTMGIHTGPVIGTIIGTTRKFFRIFGDTVNTTSRVCTTGLEGCIQATQQTYGLSFANIFLKTSKKKKKKSECNNYFMFVR